MQKDKLGAYRLFTHLLYGQFRHMDVMPRSIIQLNSIYTTARILGTDSKRVRDWLKYLEDLGYVESLQFTPNNRAAKFRLKAPSNTTR